MSEQHSQKRGVHSEAQKTTTARHDYEPVPPASPVGGAFGEQQKDHQSDGDLAHTLEERRLQKTQANEETE